MVDNNIKIFVSYTTKDSHIETNYLKEVYKRVSSLGSVYIDLLHNDSLNKQNRVHEELISSDLLLLIDSESINQSHWVTWEISMAKKTSIPIIKLDPKFSIKELQNICTIKKLTSHCI